MLFSSILFLVLGMIQLLVSVQFLQYQPTVDGLVPLLLRRHSRTSCLPRLSTTRPSLSSSMASGQGRESGCESLFILGRPLQAKAEDEEGDDNDKDGPIPTSEDGHVQREQPHVHSVVETALDEAKNPGPASTTTSRFTLMSVVRTVGNLVLELWSAAILFLGACFTLGLLLNLLGYGYRFDKTEFLHVDTLENMRTERQFQQVSRRYGREYSSSKMFGGDIGATGEASLTGAAAAAGGGADNGSVPVRPK